MSQGLMKLEKSVLRKADERGYGHFSGQSFMTVGVIGLKTYSKL